jgi:hypothetical protein
MLQITISIIKKGEKNKSTNIEIYEKTNSMIVKILKKIAIFYSTRAIVLLYSLFSVYFNYEDFFKETDQKLRSQPYDDGSLCVAGKDEAISKNSLFVIDANIVKYFNSFLNKNEIFQYSCGTKLVCLEKLYNDVDLFDFEASCRFLDEINQYNLFKNELILKFVKSEIDISFVQKQVIIFCLLGDATIQNNQFIYAQSIIHNDYFFYIQYLLSNLVSSGFKYVSKYNHKGQIKSTYLLSFSTIVHNFIAFIRSKFYNKNGEKNLKIINEELVEKYLDYFSLALLICDDGTKSGRTITICTDNFKKDDIDKLIRILFEKYGVNTKTTLIYNKYYVWYFNTKTYISNLYKNLQDFIFPTMRYKLGFNVIENKIKYNEFFIQKLPLSKSKNINQCRLCDYSSPKEKIKQRKFGTHTNTHMPYFSRCKFCNKLYVRKNSIQSHITRNHNCLYCYICKKAYFVTKQERLDHNSTVHKNNFKFSTVDLREKSTPETDKISFIIMKQSNKFKNYNCVYFLK